MAGTFGGHRQMMPAPPGVIGAGGSARLNELLDSIRQEFEAASQDSSMHRMQREDFEHKIAVHVQEMNQIQQNIFELERVHQKMKQQYEEEILRLRRELELRGGAPPPSSISFQQTGPASQTTTGMFPSNGLMSLAGGQQQQQQQLQQQQQQQQLQPGQMGYQMAGGLRKPVQQPVTYPPPQAMQPQQHLMQQPQQQQQQQQQQPQPSRPVASKPVVFFEDVDSETITAAYRHEGADWLALFNPKIERNLDIDLIHNFDHQSVVCCVKYSKDGKMLATGCNRVTQVYDVVQGQKIATLIDENGHEGDLYIRSVCFSPDGSMLATGAEDKLIRIWDLEEKKIKMVLSGHDQDIYSLDFSRDGKFIASGSGDRTAKLWNVETGQCIFTLGNDGDGSKDAGVTSVAISPDGKTLAAGSLDRLVRLWDIESGKVLARMEGHKDSVYSVSFSPDGRFLVSGSLDKTLKLWDVKAAQSGKTECKTTFNGHKDFVLSVAFSADGTKILSGSKDRTVQLWDVNSTRSMIILQGHKNSVISVALNPEGGMFATGSGDCKARLWKFGPLTTPPAK